MAGTSSVARSCKKNHGAKKKKKTNARDAIEKMRIIKVGIDDVGTALHKLSEHCGCSKSATHRRVVVHERNDNREEERSMFLESNRANLKV